ncbi:ferritin-like domain-containing protein [Pirellulaceae bacterium SH449]
MLAKANRKRDQRTHFFKEIYMTKLETLADAFYAELQDIYSAEQQLVKALPKMVKKASSEKLTLALTEHLEATKAHVDRVVSAFDETGKAAKAKKCEAMAGLIKEVEETMAQDADSDVADAILIGLAQKVEHYEIATYGTLCTWADQLGYSSAKKLLGQNMDDEEKADKMLSKLSKTANLAANA